MGLCYQMQNQGCDLSRFRTRGPKKSGGHGGLFGLGRHAFEELFHSLGRHLVADRRVGPAAVAVRLDELDHRMLGRVPGREASPVVHLILKRGEERLGHRVVVAAAGAVRLQVSRTSLSRAHSDKSLLACWAPRSAWNMALPAT